MNNVVLVGRMTKDPELRRTNNGDCVTSFTLAVNRGYQSADGVQADFIPCVVWGKVAENTSKFCGKGSLVGVEGRLRTRTYDNAQGNKVFVVEVVCSSVQFLETKASKERTEQSQVSKNNFYDMKTVDLDAGFTINEDDLAF